MEFFDLFGKICFVALVFASAYIAMPPKDPGHFDAARNDFLASPNINGIRPLGYGKLPVSLRAWLIEKLAGGRVVVMNAQFGPLTEGEKATGLVHVAQTKEAIIIDNIFDAAVPIKITSADHRGEIRHE